MKIVITGSLGNISRPLAEDLANRNHSLTIITSDVNKRSEIEALGASAAIGSIEDPAFLAETFRDADAAYCMTPPKFNEPDQIAYYVRIAEAYASALRGSGIRKAIYLSSYGAHLSAGTGFITGSHKAEGILNSVQDLTLVHMRPTFFYYNLLNFIPMIQSAGFIGAVYGGQDRLAMVSPRDIASAIAEELISETTTSGVRYVSSDDRSCSEIAKVLGSAIGRPDLEWKVLPPDAVLASLISSGMPKNAAENLVELGTAIHNGRLREDYDKHKPVFGNVSLEQFASEFAITYRQSSTGSQY